MAQKMSVSNKRNVKTLSRKEKDEREGKWEGKGC